MRRAREIRLRAERKCGQMLADSIERADRGRPSKTSGEPTLSDLGISRDQSSQWQKLAAVPDETFEADLADPAWSPTTAGLIERQEARTRGPLPPMQLQG
jgi:hypothetical protein